MRQVTNCISFEDTHSGTVITLGTDNTVNCCLLVLGWYIFARGFTRSNKRRGLSPRGLIAGIKKIASKQAKVVLIKTRFAFTGFYN